MGCAVSICEHRQGALVNTDNPSSPQPVPFVRYTHAQVAQRYSFPSTDATGQTVGAIGWGAPGAIGVDVGALTKYFQNQGIPVPSITVVPIGNQKNGATSGELQMDCEIVGTFAQKAAIRVYLALGGARDIAAAIQQAVTD